MIGETEITESEVVAYFAGQLADCDADMSDAELLEIAGADDVSPALQARIVRAARANFTGE